MPYRRFSRCLLVALALLLPSVGPAMAQGEVPRDPFLRLSPQGHGAVINRVITGDDGRLLTVSDDKTLREWSAGGDLLATYRPPIGHQDEGALFAVAASDRHVAVAGRTGLAWNRSGAIYVFDRASMTMLGAISGLPGAVGGLDFSADGRYLAAALLGTGGVSVLDLTTGRVAARLKDLGAPVTWIDHDPAGRLVVATGDGRLRVFGKDFALRAEARLADGGTPFSIAVSPDGGQLAVGLRNRAEVHLFTLPQLTEGARLTGRTGQGPLTAVSWLDDGRRIAAGGLYRNADGRRLVVVWDHPSGRLAREVPVSEDTITDLAAMPDGGIAYVSGEPGLGVLSRALTPTARVDSPLADYRDIGDVLAVSADGGVVDFALARGGTKALRFSLDARRLGQTVGGVATRASVMESATLHLRDARNGDRPMINGVAIPLEAGERGLAGAVLPGRDAAVLGSNFYLRMVDSLGRPIWKIVPPGPVWGVAPSGDERLLVAAVGDGTLRWYDAATGEERLALFVPRDGGRWIAWTPEGFFDHSAPEPGQPSPVDLIGYHMNVSGVRAGKFVGARQLYTQFYRKDLVARSLDGARTEVKEAVAALGDVQQVLGRGLPPQVQIVEVCEPTPDGGQACVAPDAPTTRDAAPPAMAVRSQEVLVRVDVIDQGGGLGDVRLRRDGTFQKTRFSVLDTDRKRRREEHWVALAEGENTVRIAARSASGVETPPMDEASLHLVFEPEAEAAPEEGGRTLYVVAVGINGYHHISPLDNASRDAHAISELMKDSTGPLYQRVDMRVLTESDATSGAIIDAFTYVADRARPEDMLMVFLAGHGEAVEGRYYFAPVDMGAGFQDRIADAGNLTQEQQEDLLSEIYKTEGLSQDRLVELFGRIQAREAVLLIDTCYSGAVVNDTWVNVLAEDSGRFVMAGSTETQLALDGGQGNGVDSKHGLFTQKVLEALNGQADWDRDQIVDVSELAKYARREVPRAAKEMGFSGAQAQEPTYYIGSKDLFGVRSL